MLVREQFYYNITFSFKYDQLLLSMLYAMHQKDHRKSTDTKVACKMMMNSDYCSQKKLVCFTD